LDYILSTLRNGSVELSIKNRNICHKEKTEILKMTGLVYTGNKSSWIWYYHTRSC